MPQPQSGEPAFEDSEKESGSPPQGSSRGKPRSAEQNSPAGTDPIALLREDHRRVESLFAEFEKEKDAQQKSQLAKNVCAELVVHTLLEEAILYPACRGHMDKRLLDEAQVEHDGTKA